VKNRSVALLLETSNAYSRGLLDGIIGFVQQHRRWSVYLPEQERGADPPEWLRRWKGDGIIARIETHEIARAVRATRLPVVDVSAGRFIEEIPWLETDDQKIASLAADHLLQRGFRNLAFCADPGFQWSVLREQQFAKSVAEAGANYFLHQSVARTDPWALWRVTISKLSSCLRSVVMKESPSRMKSRSSVSTMIDDCVNSVIRHYRA
jgi:LacI family transcriptional regulator